MKTNLVMVIDRSGSMAIVQDEATMAINAFIKDQQAVKGKCRFTLVQFDTTSLDVVCDNVKLDGVKADYQLVARGGTPLFDAVGGTIHRVEAQEKEKPSDKVIFVILTDGMENSSHEFSQGQILEMVQAKTAEGWDFVYLGAAQSMEARAEHYAQAANIGTQAASTSAHSSSNYAGAMASTSSAVSRTRTVGGNVEYTAEERKQAEK